MSRHREYREVPLDRATRGPDVDAGDRARGHRLGIELLSDEFVGARDAQHHQVCGAKVWFLHVVALARPGRAGGRVGGGGEPPRRVVRPHQFLGVLSQDLVLQSDSTWRQSSGWFGRYTWRDRHRAKDVVDEFELRVRTAGRAWPPLQAGLFGGDIDRALQAIAAYGEDFKQLQRRRH